MEKHNYSRCRPLFNCLDYNGFAVSTKCDQGFTDATAKQTNKGDMDIKLAVNMLVLSEQLNNVSYLQRKEFLANRLSQCNKSQLVLQF